MRFTLRQIQVFLAIAHHGNVSKAALELAMSQSAASGALKELEHHFNIELFDRVSKRLQLNASGYALLPKAEALYTTAEDVEAALTSTALTGTLHIGATLTIGNYLCMDVIADYQKTNTDKRVRLSIANTETIKRELLNFDIDIGMLEGEIHHPDLDIKPWRKDELIVFCSPEHPLAQQKYVSVDDLMSASWVLREPGSGTRQTFDRAMRDHLTRLNITLELEQTEAIKGAVTRGLGIGCLSSIALKEEFRHNDFIALNCRELDLTRTFYIAVHRDKYRNAGLREWLTLCDV